MLGHRRHFATRRGTAAARLGAGEHHLIAVRQPLAILRARIADVGAHPAHAPVELRHPQHKIGALHTALGAIEQQADMRLRGMLATHLQTMADCLGTGAVAVKAVSDALLHRAVHLMSPCVCHLGSFLLIVLLGLKIRIVNVEHLLGHLYNKRITI
jgi:hypothetical protein